MNIQEQMKLDMTKNLALLLMENNLGMTMEQAISVVMNSETYQRLQNDATHLYYQSPRYVYDFLDKELKLGKVV
ncbi:MAG: hypothetical protein IKU79_02610 [Bacteroidaceae bacterium]|jgi:hypothetical protein|nr:hypothetical protein [Bacteroidaceae bacterium]